MNRTMLLETLETAYDWAKTRLDLSQFPFGISFLDEPFIDQPLPYFFFVAGLVAQLHYSRILEIGTHFGGSICSMVRGLEYAGPVPQAEIVTVDIVSHDTKALRDSPSVKCIPPSSMSRIITVDYAPQSAVSPDKSVRRSAQDDESVGALGSIPDTPLARKPEFHNIGLL